MIFIFLVEFLFTKFCKENKVLKSYFKKKSWLGFRVLDTRKRLLRKGSQSLRIKPKKGASSQIGINYVSCYEYYGHMKKIIRKKESQFKFEDKTKKDT